MTNVVKNFYELGEKAQDILVQKYGVNEIEHTLVDMLDIVKQNPDERCQLVN